jgi:hypothetical protein
VHGVQPAQVVASPASSYTLSLTRSRAGLDFLAGQDVARPSLRRPYLPPTFRSVATRACCSATLPARVDRGFSVDRVRLIRKPTLGLEITGRADYVGQYAHSSLGLVANYVPRPTLQRKIKEQLHDGRESGGAQTRMLAVWGLGVSGKLQLVLNYI